MTLIETKEQAIRLLEEAVAERGEDFSFGHYASEGCMYRDVVTGQPSCIVGLAMAKAGISLDRLFVREEGGNPYFNGKTINFLASEEVFPVSPEAAEIFAAAQTEQDKGASWGAALEAARREAGLVSA